MKSKIKSFKQIQAIAQKLHRERKKIVFTNGCFDILHSGHVYYLTKAKSLGDFLVVGLNTDRSVHKIKGPSRPINSERARAVVLSALQVVDFVVLFDESTPLSLIKSVRPDILVKGSDWQLRDIAGAKEVIGWGGKVKRVPLLKGYSTTSIIQQMAGPK